MNEIAYLFNRIKSSECEFDKEECENKILSLAKLDQKYLDQLVNLFLNEQNIEDKIELAIFLAQLQYGNVIPFLLKTLETTDIDHQYDAAMALVTLSHPEGYEFVIKLLHAPKIIPIGWFFSSLEKINNDMAKKLLDYAEKLYPD